MMTDHPGFQRFWKNAASKRYILALNPENRQFPAVEVYDQRNRRFLPEEEWETVKADEILRLK